MQKKLSKHFIYNWLVEDAFGEYAIHKLYTSLSSKILFRVWRFLTNRRKGRTLLAGLHMPIRTRRSFKFLRLMQKGLARWFWYSNTPIAFSINNNYYKSNTRLKIFNKAQQLFKTVLYRLKLIPITSELSHNILCRVKRKTSFIRRQYNPTNYHNRRLTSRWRWPSQHLWKRFSKKKWDRQLLKLRVRRRRTALIKLRPNGLWKKAAVRTKKYDTAINKYPFNKHRQTLRTSRFNKRFITKFKKFNTKHKKLFTRRRKFNITGYAKKRLSHNIIKLHCLRVRRVKFATTTIKPSSRARLPISKLRILTIRKFFSNRSFKPLLNTTKQNTNSITTFGKTLSLLGTLAFQLQRRYYRARYKYIHGTNLPRRRRNQFVSTPTYTLRFDFTTKPKKRVVPVKKNEKLTLLSFRLFHYNNLKEVPKQLFSDAHHPVYYSFKNFRLPMLNFFEFRIVNALLRSGFFENGYVASSIIKRQLVLINGFAPKMNVPLNVWDIITFKESLWWIVYARFINFFSTFVKLVRRNHQPTLVPGFIKKFLYARLPLFRRRRNKQWRNNKLVRKGLTKFITLKNYIFFLPPSYMEVSYKLFTIVLHTLNINKTRDVSIPISLRGLLSPRPNNHLLSFNY